MSPLHVVFSMSAAVDLRSGLVLAGRDDRVVALADNLSFGPIDPPDPALRAAWIEAELGYEGWDEVGSESEKFWALALAADSLPTAWISRRSVQDYTGFLEFLWRLGDRPCNVVDLTDQMVTHHDDEGRVSKPHLVLSPALLNPYQFVENKLFDLAQPLTTQARSAYRATWQKLRAENAPLRILASNLALISAPISYFDAALQSYITERWQKVARVVADVMVKYSDLDVLHIDDLVLAARVRALAGAGLVEAKGDLMQIRFSEIRLPGSGTLIPAN